MSAAGGLRARLAARIGELRLDLELEAEPGTLVVVGPNGAGKSTLLKLLLGALPVERGRIEVAGELLLDSDRSFALPLEERRLGYVPQDYALFPHLSVRQNVAFALASSPDRLGRAALAVRVEAVLRELALESLAERRPHTLSGGERQRAALARALAVRPRALLLDEPLAALDAGARPEVRRLLAARLGELALPAVVVTHDALDAQELGRRVAVLEAGRIVQCGSWAELAARPATAFVERLLASSPALSSSAGSRS